MRRQNKIIVLLEFFSVVGDKLHNIVLNREQNAPSVLIPTDCEQHVEIAFDLVIFQRDESIPQT